MQQQTLKLCYFLCYSKASEARLHRSTSIVAVPENLCNESELK